MKTKDDVPDIDFNDPIEDDEDDERQPARRVPGRRRQVFRRSR